MRHLTIRMLSQVGSVVTACAFGTPAFAEDAEPGQGSCTPVFTSQHRNCAAMHVYSCKGADGPYQKYEHVEGNEITSIDLMTEDYDFISSSLPDGTPIMRMISSADPFSTAELLDTGKESEAREFEMIIYGLGVPGSASLNYQVERQVQIDNRAFWKVSLVGGLDIAAPVGRVEASGEFYIDAETRFVVDGVYRMTIAGEESASSGEPVDILLPGEEGFGVSRAVYDCGELSFYIPEYTTIDEVKS